MADPQRDGAFEQVARPMSDSNMRNGGPADHSRRHYATILFSDLSGSTGLSASMENETYAELLAEVRRVCIAVVPSYGGTIIQIQGDGFLALFGYPESSEDDGRRAVDAALNIHEAIRRLRKPPDATTLLTMHSGIHSGRVLVEDGDSVRGRLTLSGEAANVAAKLCASASADEIVVSDQTLGSDANFFCRRDPKTVTVAGIREPIRCMSIAGRADPTSRFDARRKRGLTPFVGRTRELHFLADCLGDVKRGSHKYVAVIAPLGVGKTRLLRQFLKQCDSGDCSVLSGYCDSYLNAEPLQPLVEMLRSFCSIAPPSSVQAALAGFDEAFSRFDLPRRQLDLFRRLLSLSIDDGEGEKPFSVEEIAAAFMGFFRALASIHPTVAFFDDLQWADAGTLHIIDAVAELHIDGLFLVKASREGGQLDLRSDAANVIRLEPFGVAESAAIVASLAPGSDPFQRSAILEGSGGNPLYIEELCHFLASAGVVNRFAAGAVASGWLNAIVEARVARLPRTCADAVRAAAVIGNIIPNWLLEALLGRTLDETALRLLAEHDLIFPGDTSGTLRFKHGIVREVVYGSVGLHHRKELHRQIAAFILGSTPEGTTDNAYETLAYHFGAAGQSLEAAHFAELAGDKATTAFALDRAQAQYRAALNALDRCAQSNAQDEKWLLIAQRFAFASVFDPTRDQLVILTRAVERATQHGDQRLIARAHYWLGYMNYALGESRLASAQLEQGLKYARDAQDAALVAQLLATWGQAKASACDYPAALGLLEKAVVLKGNLRKTPRSGVGLAYTLACQASVWGDHGEFRRAHACFEQAISVVVDIDHEVKSSVLCWQSAVCSWQGRWHDAVRFAAEAERIALRVRSVYLYAKSVSLRGFAHWMATGNSESIRETLKATRWLEASDRSLFISLHYGWLADWAMRNGDIALTREYAAKALCCARKGDRLGEAMACRAMAQTAARGNSGKLAGHFLDLADASGLARGSTHEAATTRLCRAQINLMESNSRGAHDLSIAEAEFERMDMRWHLGEARRVRLAHHI